MIKVLVCMAVIELNAMVMGVESAFPVRMRMPRLTARGREVVDELDIHNNRKICRDWFTVVPERCLLQ